MFSSSDDRTVNGNVPVFEALEERVMLTTLVGGSVAEYWQPTDYDNVDDPRDGGPIQIRLEGDIIAEFMAVGISTGNEIRVGDLPVRIVSGSPASVAGGIAACDGVMLIGETPITDPDGVTQDFTVPEPDPDQSEFININAIASEAYETGGRTYGFNVYNEDLGGIEMTYIQLLEINNATGDARVVAELSGVLPRHDEDDGSGGTIEVSDIVTVSGADFRPLDGSDEEGWLYFTCEIEPEDGDTAYRLFALDVHQNPDYAANRAAIEGGGDLNPVTTLTTNDQQIVPSIAWESSSMGSTLYMVRTDSGVAEVHTVFRPALPLFLPALVTPITFLDADGAAVTEIEDISGIEFVADDPEASERYLYAVMVNGGDSQLLRIDLVGDDQSTPPVIQGWAESMGYLQGYNPLDPSDTRYPPDYTGPYRGNALQGLAWNPVLVNPFTYGYGTLIATDVITDELVYVRTGSDETPPIQPTLNGWAFGFAIYIAHAGEDASIAISVRDANDPDVLIPFGGGFMDDIQITDAQSGDLMIIDVPDGIGGALLGAATMDFIDDTLPRDEGTLITSALIGFELGVRPEHYDDWPGVEDDLAAGLVIPETVVEYYSGAGSLDDRLLGMNLDDIREMSVSRSGQIVVVDYDGVDAAGNSYYDLDGDGVWDPDLDIIIGAQISLVDSGTGHATDNDAGDDYDIPPMNILDIGDGTPVTGVWGLDYGDVSMDGNEQLYAVCTIGRSHAMWLGTIAMDFGLETAFFDPIVELTDLGGDPFRGVKSMAFSPGQGAIDGQQGLYITDSYNRIFEVDPVTGATLTGGDTVWTALVYPDGSPVLDDQGDPVIEIVVVESMDFDDDGILFAHDRRSGRLVDIDLSDLGTGQLWAGGWTATPVGTMRPTIGAMAYDFANDQFLAVDNVIGHIPRDDEASWDPNSYLDSRALDSSALLRVLGTDSDSSIGQSMNKFLLAGTVTGKVDLSGSIETFYAGWLITGQPGPTPPRYGWTGENALASGFEEELVADAPAYVKDNFHVRGDLRNLISLAAIGTDLLPPDSGEIDEPAYITGFDLQVGGKLGTLWTLDSFLGRATVENQRSVFNFPTTNYYEEIEYVLEGSPPYPDSDSFKMYELFNPSGHPFNNDTMATAQYLGAIAGRNLGDPDIIRVNGELGARAGALEDAVDFYAVSLMAGQTITVQLLNLAGINVGIFDPDGRLIATDRDDVAGEFNPLWMSTQPFRFTARRAGMHYFAVGNVEFPGSTPDRGTLYTLSIDFADELDDLALGGVRVYGNLFDYEDTGGPQAMDPRFWVHRGDMGAIVVNGQFVSEVSGFGQDVLVEAGNLRAIEAASFGRLTAALDPTDPSGAAAGEDALFIDVRGGGAGLLRTTDPDDAMLIFSVTLQGDMQTIEAAGELWLQLSAWGGLGNLRANLMSMYNSGGLPQLIQVNADGYGRDGVIDLIDVAGQFGEINNGGPVIMTGEGGNVRFMRVGGPIWQDREWSDTTPIDTDVPPGEPIHLWDDSGTKISIYPVSDTVDAGSGLIPLDPLTGLRVIDPATGVPFVDASLNVTYYGIHDSGGVAILDITSTENVAIIAESHENGDHAEIGRITLNGDGRAVLIDPVNGSMSQAPHPYPGFVTDLTVLITAAIDEEGNEIESPLDVFEIVGGDFTSIQNLTGGDIVNITAASINLLENHGSLGVTPVHNGAEIDATVELSSALPFLQQTTGIVSGSIIAALAGGAVGNFIVTGDIGQIEANVNGVVDHTDPAFYGVAAPVYASGDIREVNIGEGIAPSGTGAFALAGIFADGVVRYVTNQGIGSDIRGDIVGTGGIELIELFDGAIINGDILAGEFVNFCEYEAHTGLLWVGDIGEIHLKGVGGIIGSYIRAVNIDRIRVENGFGIFSSFIASTYGSGRIQDVIVDGYGFNTVRFFGGAYLDKAVATGRGDIVSTLLYTPTARYSEDYTYEPLFGARMSPLTDIHAVLGTSALYPESTEGIWQTVDASAQLDLGLAKGYQFFNVQLTFANTIGTIEVLDLINGLRITTGHLAHFKPGADVYALDMNVAGTIGDINVKGNLADNSSIQAYGSNGNIKSVLVRGDFDGEMIADGRIGSIAIWGDLSGLIEIDDTNESKLALKQLILRGSLRNGALDIRGNVGTIRVFHDLGALGDTLFIDGNLGSLYVGADGAVDGSTMLLDLNVTGNLGLLDVTGRLDGEVYVGGDLRNLAVRADTVTAGDDDLVAGNFLIRRDLVSALIQGGSLASEITVGDRIGSFIIVDGDLAAGAVVTSSYGDIGTVQVRTGDLFGEIHADRGTIQTVRIGGSDVRPGSQITAMALANLNVDGHVMNGALVDIVNELGVTRIGGDVQAGSVVRAGSGKTFNVAGSLAGSVNLGVSNRPTNVSIGLNLAGDLTLGGDAAVTVGNELADGATLSVAGDLNNLAVVDLLAGGVFVDGYGGRFSAGRVAGAVITTGFDLNALNVADTMENTLVQVGIRRGDDSAFADGAGVAADLGETSRTAVLKALSIGGVLSDSIIASGGDISKVTVRGGMTGSSVSSGLSVGSEAIAVVLDDDSPLDDPGKQNAARSGADRQLLVGDLGATRINGVGLVASALTAGVDAGADGRFDTPADNNVLSSLTGGASEMGPVYVADGDADSAILADAGIRFPSRNGNGPPAGTLVDDNVTYAIADLTAPDPADYIGTATRDASVIYTTAGGHIVTVNVVGNGEVAVYDQAGGAGDDLIDMLIITGADAKTRISVVASTPGAVSVGRVVTADDVALGAFEMDGALVGDGGPAPDLLLDAGVGRLTLGVLGGDVSWSGRIGSDVRTLEIGAQALGTLRIGGGVGSVYLIDGADDLWVFPTADPTWPDEIVAAVTSDGTGEIWLYDGVTRQLHPASDAAGVRRVDVTDALWNALDISAMDFLNAGNVMYAVTHLYNQIPSQQVGATQEGPVDLVGLAVDADDRVLAVEKGSTTDWGYDELVEIDTQTGVRTTIGILRDVYSNLMVENVMAIAFDNAGRLYALLADYDGLAPGFDSSDGVVLAAIETTDINGDWTLRVGHPHPAYAQHPGALIDGGGVTDPFTAMAVNDTGDIYAIRRAGGQDILVELVIDDSGPGLPTVSMDVIGAVQVLGADTNIVGIAFDQHDNLVAYNTDGLAADMVAVNVADPGDSTLITAAGILNPDIDAFAAGRTDVFHQGWDDEEYPTFAYDTGNPLGSTMYTNLGWIQTLGIVDTDPASGQFVLLHGMSEYAEDADGTPLPGRAISSTVVDIAVDGADTDLIFAVTADGRLLSYSRADGTLDTEVGPLVNPYTGETAVISEIDFDEATGDLVGFDARYHRLVTIDKATGETVPRTESGSLDADVLTGLSCDPAGGSFYTFDTTTGEVMELRRIDHVAPSGIVAASIESLRILTDTGYHGRVATTGNTFGRVIVDGDFEGLLASATDIRSFVLTGGDFAGALTAGGSITVTIRQGDFLANGLIDAGDTLNLNLTHGEFAGTIAARDAGTIGVGEDIDEGFELGESDLALADVNVRGHANKVSITGGFTGAAHLGSAGVVKFESLVDEGLVNIAGDAAKLIFAGSTDPGSFAVVGGRLGNLVLRGVHSGIIAVAQGMGSARLNDMNQGILNVAEDTGSVRVRDAVGSLLSFGTWIGDDLVYNTADDVITGGGLNNAQVRTFQDSVIAVGVLPNLNVGAGIPDDKYAYIGNPYTTDPAEADAADAGGLLTSEIKAVRIQGNVVNTSPFAGHLSAVAAADDLRRVYLRRKGTTLRTRIYGDPFGAPTVVEVISANDSEVQIIFSEEMNSASLTLAQDIDFDAALASLSDIQGTVLVRDAYNYFVTDVELDYTTRVTDDGTVQGVLLIRREGGFDTPTLQIQILGDIDLGAYDRSGMRSSFRNPNLDDDVADFEDRPGTLLDGDANANEGGAFWLIPHYDDVGDTFTDAAWVDFTVVGPGDYAESATVLEWLEIYPDDDGWTDVDVFAFDGLAHEFFSYAYTGPMDVVNLGLFFLDDQGTPADPDDDTHELVAREEFHGPWAYMDSVGPIDQVCELPRTGTYFVAVAHYGFNRMRYQLELTVASSDDMLDGRIDGVTGVDRREEIAYVSNKVGDNNNLLGANTPMQLVYLDFDGGQTTKYAAAGDTDVTVAPVDASLLDPAFQGMTDVLIHGNDDVAGIVENMMAIYLNNPVGSVNVFEIDTQAEWEQALEDFDNDVISGGLYFTTVDPATWGLDPDTDFTTVFFDSDNSATFGGALGMASTVDLANMAKADNAMIFLEEYRNYGFSTSSPTLSGRLNEWSMAIANIAAHEFGHTLGLNHQPKTFTVDDVILMPDDPDNEGPLTSDDSNQGYALMSYPATEVYTVPWELGTLTLSIEEFPIGQIDTADLVSWWLA